VEDHTATVAMSAGLGAVLIGALAIPMADTWWVVAPITGLILAGIGGLRMRWRKRRQVISSLLDRLAVYVTTAARHD
jgi:hypothetical protein